MDTVALVKGRVVKFHASHIGQMHAKLAECATLADCRSAECAVTMFRCAPVMYLQQSTAMP